MISKSPTIDALIYRTLFSASLVYFGIALIILRPTNSFGLAHCLWAVICGIGSGLGWKAARQRVEDEASKSTSSTTE